MKSNMISYYTHYCKILRTLLEKTFIILTTVRKLPVSKEEGLPSGTTKA